MRTTVTEEQKDFVRKHYLEMTQVELAVALGVSQPWVSWFLRKEGLSRYWTYEGNGYRVVLTPFGEAYLKARFKNTKNDTIKKVTGLSDGALHRFARRLGLTKTRAFMKKVQSEAAMLAHEVNREKGWPPKGYHIPRSEEFRFKKGVDNLMRLGPEKNAERIRKSADSLAQTRKEEKARVAFGLPQRTRLRVKRQPERKIRLRCYLKRRGYVIDEAAHVAYWTEDTRRAPRLEARNDRYYRYMEWKGGSVGGDGTTE